MFLFSKISDKNRALARIVEVEAQLATLKGFQMKHGNESSRRGQLLLWYFICRM
jgi:hypothetical protein